MSDFTIDTSDPNFFSSFVGLVDPGEIDDKIGQLVYYVMDENDAKKTQLVEFVECEDESERYVKSYRHNNCRAGRVYPAMLVNSIKGIDNLLVFHDGDRLNPLCVYSPQYSKPEYDISKNKIVIPYGCWFCRNDLRKIELEIKNRQDDFYKKDESRE